MMVLLMIIILIVILCLLMIHYLKKFIQYKEKFNENDLFCLVFGSIITSMLIGCFITYGIIKYRIGIIEESNKKAELEINGADMKVEVKEDTMTIYNNKGIKIEGENEK